VQSFSQTGRTPALLCLLALAVAAPLTAQDGQHRTVAPNETPVSESAAGANAASDSGDATRAEAAAGLDASAAARAEAAWAYADTEAADQPEVSVAGLLLKVGLGLSFVVGLAWGCVFLLKKSSVGQQFAPVTAGIRILERSYLAPKRAVYLVEIGDRTLALGVTEQNISVLSRWAAGQLQLPERHTSDSGFAAQFRSLLERGANRSRNESSVGASGQPEARA